MEESLVPETCEHNFLFLRRENEEVSWHNWKTFDIFYCTKCLEQRKIEVPEKQEHRG
jgi:hypothetical protein